MVRIKLPDSISPQRLHKALIGEQAVQRALLAVKHKPNEPFLYFQLAQIQKSIDADRKNALALLRQGVKGPDFPGAAFLQKPRLRIVDVPRLYVVEGLLKIREIRAAFPGRHLLL